MVMSAIVPDRYPKEVKLQGGTGLLFRPLQAQDEKALYDFFQRIPPEDRVFFRDDVSRPEVVRAWCHNIDYERVFPLLALKGTRVVADATLHQDQFGWMRHVAEIRVSVDPELRGVGVASRLIEELVQLAQDVGIEKIDAQFVSTQTEAKAPFERLGFAPAAVLPRHVRDQEGREHDLVLLVRDLLQAEYFAGD